MDAFWQTLSAINQGCRLWESRWVIHVSNARALRKSLIEPVSGSSRGYDNIRQPLPPRDLRSPKFSAASGEGDVAARPPEVFYNTTYSASTNAMSSERHHEAPYPNVPDPHVSRIAPWEPWFADLAVMNAPRIGYGESSGLDVTPYSTTSTSSATNDVPARAPHVSSSYSANSIY